MTTTAPPESAPVPTTPVPARLHLAFVTPGVMGHLRSGAKTVESRLSTRPHPAARVRPGDALLFKAGDVGGLAVVLRVETFASYAPLKLDDLRARYGRAVDPAGDLEWYWEAKRDARYAVFLHLGALVPLFVDRRDLPTTRSAWIEDYRPDRDVRRRISAAIVAAH